MRRDRKQTEVEFVNPGEGNRASNFFTQGEEFLRAAQQLCGASADDPYEDDGADLFSPKAYLFCHSIELFLKSYLALNSVEDSAWKPKKGHELNFLLDLSRPFGFVTDEVMEAQIAHLAPLHGKDSDFRLRYQQRGSFSLPPVYQMNGLATTIRDQVRAARRSKKI